eukprot:symbB.v1.2.022612.t2/scaffold2017.1/size92264/3
MRNDLLLCNQKISGTHGMKLLQRAVREATPKTRVRLLHWSVFNPIEATEAKKMHQYLENQDVNLPQEACALHIFRKVRDEWRKLGLPMPKMPRLHEGVSAEKRRTTLLDMVNASRHEHSVSKILRFSQGWTIKTKVRKKGTSAGQVDVYWFSKSGEKFRSMPEVARHFGLVKECRRGAGAGAELHVAEPPIEMVPAEVHHVVELR